MSETVDNYELINVSGVLEMLGLSKSALYRLRKSNQFPAPIKLTENKHFWLKNEVQEWVHQKILSSKSKDYERKEGA